MDKTKESTKLESIMHWKAIKQVLTDFQNRNVVKGGVEEALWNDDWWLYPLEHTWELTWGDWKFIIDEEWLIKAIEVFREETPFFDECDQSSVD